MRGRKRQRKKNAKRFDWRLVCLSTTTVLIGNVEALVPAADGSFWHYTDEDARVQVTLLGAFTIL